MMFFDKYFCRIFYFHHIFKSFIKYYILLIKILGFLEMYDLYQKYRNFSETNNRSGFTFNI